MAYACGQTVWPTRVATARVAYPCGLPVWPTHVARPCGLPVWPARVATASVAYPHGRLPARPECSSSLCHDAYTQTSSVICRAPELDVGQPALLPAPLSLSAARAHGYVGDAAIYGRPILRALFCYYYALHRQMKVVLTLRD